jgi:hypothetical protein
MWHVNTGDARTSIKSIIRDDSDISVDGNIPGATCTSMVSLVPTWGRKATPVKGITRHSSNSGVLHFGG